MEKTLEGAKELLNSILLTDNTPILFLGAGFSCGASNKANAMDGCKLKDIFMIRWQKIRLVRKMRKK
jgi:hypothetical protein